MDRLSCAACIPVVKDVRRRLSCTPKTPLSLCLELSETCGEVWSSLPRACIVKTMLQTNDFAGTVTAPRCIRAGDLVIVYVSHEEMKPVIVTKGFRTQVRYGLFLHDDWIGTPFGSKVFSKSGSWLYLLSPTCELWTESLPHRTQILYTSDCAQICSGLDLRSGSVVRGPEAA